MHKETRIKRLIFQSAHRGCKETDLVLGQFAERGMRELSDDMLDLYEEFLEEHDADIWNWISGKTSPDDNRYDELLNLIRDYTPETNAQ
ncbi:MAG: succinate dehydrogenase assembly factor 2 [Rickettsiales bacterium]